MNNTLLIVLGLVVLSVVIFYIAGRKGWLSPLGEQPAGTPSKPVEPAAQPPAPDAAGDLYIPAPRPDAVYLAEIAAHLKSIRSMLQFFTVLVIIGLFIQACAVLLS